jgi:hypothetical protein
MRSEDAAERGVDASRLLADELAHDRPIAPGGWKRIVIGLLIGLAAGAAVALALPRDDGPRRRSLLDELEEQLGDRGDRLGG